MHPLALQWIWGLDGWMTAAAVLCALSCALLGNYLVLRRMSMMGDALSHAVLPGLAAAFLITHSRDTWAMLAGAVVVGVLTAVLTQVISQFGKVEESASMGVVFTSLFAVGLILIRRAADHVDLDPGCVLYGQLETSILDQVRFAGILMPRVIAVLAIMLLANAAFVLLFYKELKISAFDPGLATTLGINANLMHYLLMVMVAATTVVSFEAIGNILVVAMLIVPAAAAHLLTDRLGPMILVSLVIAALCGILGHLSAIVVPPWFGFQGTQTSGMMATVAGAIFVIVMLAAPRHGVIAKLAHRTLLTLRIMREDVLGMLYRAEELAGDTPIALPRPALRKALASSRSLTWVATAGLRMEGMLAAVENGFGLTPAGRERARSLLRSHRLWESYMVDELKVAPDHAHAPAERLEHVTTATMRQKLSEAAPSVDPQGKPIPRE